jgi:hypothetical protein
MLNDKITYKKNIPYNENNLIEFDLLFIETYMKDMNFVNPNYDSNKPTKTFTEKEIDELRDTFLSFDSISHVEFSWTLEFELLEFYNFKDSKELKRLFYLPNVS